MRTVKVSLWVALLCCGVQTLEVRAQDGGNVPPDPADIDACFTACEEGIDAAIAACEAAPDVDECMGRLFEDMDECFTACFGGELPEPPPEQQCLFACDEAVQEQIAACLEGVEGEGVEECFSRVEAEHRACLEACGFEPPPVECPFACELAFGAGVEACRTADGELDAACVAEQEAQYIACLEECDIEVPEEAICARGCEADYALALDECLTETNGEFDPVFGVGLDLECAMAAHEAFEVCLREECGIDVPEEVACANACEAALAAATEACGDDEACADAALEEHEECLRACGFFIPEIPDADPCVVDCDRAYREAAEACVGDGDPALGNDVDFECLSRVEEEYLECLTGCGIELPNVPPGGNPDPCLGACDQAFEAAFEQCLRNAAGGEEGEVDALDEACLAGADQAYVACLEDCGFEFPDGPDFPGIPGGECEQACAEELLVGIVGCIRADGSIDNACALGVIESFAACVESCQGENMDRVRAAIGRSRAGQFLRGDSDQNGERNLSDAVLTLNWLFAGGLEPSCADASDSNDDGRVDIADPVSLLNWLFTGGAPLPPPNEEPGRDPTEDELGCAS